MLLGTANLGLAPCCGQVPQDLTLIKIDIDSCDCEVLQGVLEHRRPWLIIIEFNPAFPPPLRFSSGATCGYVPPGRGVHSRTPLCARAAI